MEVARFSASALGEPETARLTMRHPDLIFYFGSRESIVSGQAYAQLRTLCPDATILGCTTGGQIHHNDTVDDEFTGVAIRFETTKIRLACATVASAAESRACGHRLGERLRADDLAGIFILADGLNVNGSRLVAGVVAAVGSDVPLTGGLAGDGAAFERTLVGGNDVPRSHTVAALGFYGRDIHIGHGSDGGWDMFGPSRRITGSHDNVLFELDGEPALDLYERYLGDQAAGLPGTGLFFPLRIHDPANPEHQVVRTILGIDRDARSLIFAGDVPVGWDARLMRGTFNRLSAGAANAARQAMRTIEDPSERTGVALLVSCIGRRLLMGQRVSDEIEAAADELGPLSRLGFYAYGEIAPHAVSGLCELHNQTMTITTITEAVAASETGRSRAAIRGGARHA